MSVKLNGHHVDHYSQDIFDDLLKHSERENALKRLMILRDQDPVTTATGALRALQKHGDKTTIHVVCWDIIIHSLNCRSSAGTVRHCLGANLRDLVKHTLCQRAPASTLEFAPIAAKGVASILLHFYDTWPEVFKLIQDTLSSVSNMLDSSVMMSAETITSIYHKCLPHTFDGVDFPAEEPDPQKCAALLVQVKQLNIEAVPKLLSSLEVVDSQDRDQHKTCNSVLGCLEDIFINDDNDEIQRRSHELVHAASLYMGTGAERTALKCIVAVTVTKPRAKYRQLISEALLKSGKKLDIVLKREVTSDTPFYENLKLALSALSYVSNCIDPKDFVYHDEYVWYVDAMVDLSVHPSLFVRQIAMKCAVSVIFAKPMLLDGPDLDDRVDELCTVKLPLVLSRACLPSGTQYRGYEGSVDEARAFADHDYATESDVFVDWNRCCMNLFKCIESTASRNPALLVDTTNSLLTENMRFFDFVEHFGDIWSKILRTILTSLKNKHPRTYHTAGAGLRSVSEDSLRHLKRAIRGKEWKVVDVFLSIVHALHPVTICHERTFKTYLEVVQRIVLKPVVEGPEKEHQLEATRHALGGLTHVFEEDKNQLVSHIDHITSFCDATYPHVSVMQKATITQIRAHLSNLVAPVKREPLLTLCMARIVKFILENEEKLQSYEDFVNYLAFNQAPTNEETKDSLHVLRRKELRSILREFDIFLKTARVNRLPDGVENVTERDLEEECEILYQRVKPIFSFIIRIMTFSLRTQYNEDRLVDEKLSIVATGRNVNDVLGLLTSGQSSGAPANFEEEAKRIYGIDANNTGLKMAHKFWIEYMDTLVSVMTTSAMRMPQAFGYVFSSLAEDLQTIQWNKMPIWRYRPWLRRFWKELALRRKRGTVTCFWQIFSPVMASFVDNLNFFFYYCKLDKLDSNLTHFTWYRDMVNFSNDLIEFVRAIFLDGSGLKIEEGSEMPSTLVSCPEGLALVSAVMFSMRTADVKHALQGVKFLQICLDEQEKLPNVHRRFMHINVENVVCMMGVLLITHADETNLCNHLYDYVYRLLILFTKENFDFLDTLKQVLPSEAKEIHTELQKNLDTPSTDTRANRNLVRRFATLMKQYGETGSKMQMILICKGAIKMRSGASRVHFDLWV